MKSEKVLVVYSFLACLFLMIVGVFSARTTNQLLTSFIYLPLVFFFGTRIYSFFSDPTYIRSTTPSKSVPEIDQPNIDAEIPKGVADKDKRLFLQLIGTTGISLLILALFSRKARDAFLGGGSVTEVVGIKDSAGVTINPSKEHPTDGYSITDIDDTHHPAYYAFVKNDGSWYIMQNTSGTFRYAKGKTNYSQNWDIRSKLNYDYYNHVFNS